MKTLELTAINLDAERDVTRAAARVADATGLAQDAPLDDLENPISEEAVAEAGQSPTPLNFPVVINPADVREFYARKAPMVGTRIVFSNGAARPVKETYDEVKAKFASLNN